MKISLAINFPLCYLNIFYYFINTWQISQHFQHDFSPDYARVEKYIKNVSTTLRKVNYMAKIHYSTAIT